MAGGEQSGCGAGLPLLLGVDFAEPIAQLGAGHLALELRAGQDGGEEAVLIHEDILVEGHVGDPDGLLIAQRAVVAEDRHLVDRIFMDTAMPVVIADCVGRAQVRDPAGLEQRDQPHVVLAGDRHRSGERHGERAAAADGVVEDGVDAAQEAAAERGQAVAEHLVERLALVDAAHHLAPAAGPAGPTAASASARMGCGHGER